MGIGRSKLTVEEQLAENKKAMMRSIRELDRDRLSLERQEAQLTRDIKAAAAKNQPEVVNILAKDLVRMRKHREKLCLMRSQMQAIHLQLQTARSIESMNESLKSVSEMMKVINETNKLTEVQQTAKKYVTESDKIAFSGDMVCDVIDEATFDENDEKEQTKLVQQTLDEIGVNLVDQLPCAPKTQCDWKSAEKSLEERLLHLKK